MAHGTFRYDELGLAELLEVHKLNWLRGIELPEYAASHAAIRQWPGQDPARYELRWEQQRQGRPRLPEDGDELGEIQKFSIDLKGAGHPGDTH